MHYEVNMQVLCRNYYRINEKINTNKVWCLGVKSFPNRVTSFMFNTMRTSQLQVEKCKENEKNPENKENCGKHVQITSHVFRNSTVSKAVVTDVYPLSATVKGFTLKIMDPNLTFFAGQWVDAFIPKMETIGGFSICSAPKRLKEEGLIALGIKKSLWPPAHWFYEKCCSGSEISVRVGGDFYYPHDDDDDCDLLLIAGGVGVNPIFSIYSHYNYMRSFQNKRKDCKDKTHPGKLAFLFSAKSRDELLYKSTIDSVAKSYPEEISIQYFTTRDSNTTEGVKNRRISIQDLSTGLERLNKSKTKVYICGPPSMIEALVNGIEECNIPKSRVYYEKWW